MANSEVRQRQASSNTQEVASGSGSNPPANITPVSTVTTQRESDLAFFAFFSAVLNGATTLLVVFSHELVNSWSPDEIDVLVRAGLVSTVAAGSAGVVSWFFPLVGTAVLGGIFLGIAYLFTLLAVYGNRDDPIALFAQGWVGSSALLYAVIKSRLWTPF